MKAAGHRRIALCTIIVAFTQGFRPLHGQTPSHRGSWSVAVDAGVPRGISPSMRGGTEEFRRELERDDTNSRYPFGDAGWSLSTFGGELAYAPGPLGIHLILQRASIEAGDDQGTAVMILNTASLGGEYMLGDRDARWGGFARMGLDVSMIDGYVENVLPTPSPLTSILQGSSIITHTRITTTIRYGAEAALRLARHVVLSPHRQGGQAQFIERPVARSANADRFTQALDAVRTTLGETHSLDSVAELAGLTRRTFTRRFQKSIGTSFGDWLTSQRIELAQRLLEATEKSMDVVAYEAGFGSAASLRQHFAARLRTSPAQYRREFSRRADQGTRAAHVLSS